MDKRAQQLAELTLNYSINLKKDDKLIIQFDPKYIKYANLIASKAREIGAEVKYDSISMCPVSRRHFIETNNKDEWKEELARRVELASWCNTRILICCDSNPDYAKGIENAQEIIAQFSKEVAGPYRDVLYRPGPYFGCEVRWNIVEFPFQEGAKDANMSYKEFEDFVYDATLKPDWIEMGNNMKKIKQAFDNAKEVHIQVPGLTDLKLSLEGRGGEICDGRCNMPDGEVCFGPREDSANGYITFQMPTQRPGLGVIEGIKLEFIDGVVTNYSSKTNFEALEKTLNIDAGAKKLGELGIGCNYSIKKPILETLFDEKIGGSIHLALGQSFLGAPLLEGGGLNKSDIHWDIICDLRKDESNLEMFPGGKIFIDGKLIQENGEWLF